MKRIIGLFVFSLVAAGAALEAAAAGPYSYVPIVPCRVVDTRSGFGGILGSSVERTFTVKQAGGCNVPTTAQAVALNVTVVGPSDYGWVALYPTGGTRPPVSTLNFGTTDYALANGAIVPLSTATTNELTVFLATYSGTGTTHLLLDVSGYFQ